MSLDIAFAGALAHCKFAIDEDVEEPGRITLGKDAPGVHVDQLRIVDEGSELLLGQRFKQEQ